MPTPDVTPHGLPYGAEKAQQEFQQASNAPALQPTVAQLAAEKTGRQVPALAPQLEESGLPPDMLRPPSLEMEGLGNLGDALFAPTDRPYESQTAGIGLPTGRERLSDVLYDMASRANFAPDIMALAEQAEVFGF